MPIGIGLLVMSLGSGCMDVLSYHFLGEVFTSAMTGNLALLGLRLGQGRRRQRDPERRRARRLYRRAVPRHVAATGRGRSLQATAGAHDFSSFCWGTFAWFWSFRSDDQARYGLIGLSALAMGVQTAVALRIGVHGVSTTYFTGTLANIVHGLVEPTSTPNPAMPAMRRVAWPLMAFLTYLSGAAFAGHFITHVEIADLPFGLSMAPFVTTLVLLVLIAVAGPAVRGDA